MARLLRLTDLFYFFIFAPLSLSLSFCCFVFMVSMRAQLMLLTDNRRTRRRRREKREMSRRSMLVLRQWERTMNFIDVYRHTYRCLDMHMYSSWTYNNGRMNSKQKREDWSRRICSGQLTHRPSDDTYLLEPVKDIKRDNDHTSPRLSFDVTGYLTSLMQIQLLISLERIYWSDRSFTVSSSDYRMTTRRFFRTTTIDEWG